MKVAESLALGTRDFRVTIHSKFIDIFEVADGRIQTARVAPKT